MMTEHPKIGDAECEAIPMNASTNSEYYLDNRKPWGSMMNDDEGGSQLQIQNLKQSQQPALLHPPQRGIL